LAVLWVAGSIGGFIYSQQKDIPAGVALAVLAAMLVELSLYAGLAFPAVRERCAGLENRLPFWLWASAIVPYGLYCLAGPFSWEALALLVLLAGVASWWFVLLPRNSFFDLAFLALMAGVTLAKLFGVVYPPPVEGLRVDILGQLMWIRLGVITVLVLRKFDGIGFGFLPARREWLIGLLHFALFMPIGIALMYGLGFARFVPAAGWWWKWPGTFIGILWVVALSEEFFFRGILQQYLMRWFGAAAGLALTALLFGAVHLGYREFPNWSFAAMAAVAGWFYGRACIKGEGIRAAMVAHALTVATWRTLFR